MRTFTDTFFTYATLLINQFISMLAAVAITRSMGLAGKGQVELLLSIPGILIVMGMFASSQATIFHLGKGTLTLEDLIPASLILSLLQSVILALICILFWPFLKDNLLRGLDPRLLLILVIFLPAIFLFEYNVSLFRGIEQPFLYNLYRFIRIMIYFLGIVFVWLIGKATSGTVLIAWCAALFITLVWSQIGLSKFKTRPMQYKSIWPAMKILFSYGIQIYPTLIITWLGYRIDIFLINAILDQKSVGAYSIAVSIAEAAWYLPNAVGIVILPRISRMTDDEANKFTPLVLRQVLIMMFVTVMGLYLFGRFIIIFAFGRLAEPSVFPLYFILPGIFSFAVLKIIWQDLAGRGHPLLASIPLIISVIVDVILVLILSPKFNVSGTAFASTVSYTTASILALVFFMKETKVSLRDIITFTERDKQLYRSIYNRIRKIQYKYFGF
jgi:O-antigen/teichoic acid export membrane protein